MGAKIIWYTDVSIKPHLNTIESTHCDLGSVLPTWINLPVWICNYIHCKKKLFVHSQTSTVQLSAKFWPFCCGLNLLNRQQYSYSQPNTLTSHNQREHNITCYQLHALRETRNFEMYSTSRFAILISGVWNYSRPRVWQPNFFSKQRLIHSEEK